MVYQLILCQIFPCTGCELLNDNVTEITAGSTFDVLNYYHRILQRYGRIAESTTRRFGTFSPQINILCFFNPHRQGTCRCKKIAPTIIVDGHFFIPFTKRINKIFARISFSYFHIFITVITV